VRWLLACSVVLLAACGAPGGADGAGPSSSEPSVPVQAPALAAAELPVATHGGGSGALVADWMALHAALVRRELLSPPVASRLFAYTALAMHEAASGEAGSSLASRLTGLEVRSVDPAAAGEAAMVVAVARVTRELLPGVEAQRVIGALEQQHLDRYAGADLVASSRAGEGVADDVLRWAAVDGYEAVHRRRYEPPKGPGQWEPTLPSFARALEPFWGELRTFTEGVCPVLAPPPFDVTPGSPMHAAALEVWEVSQRLSDEQGDVARFWNDRMGATSTPPGHWIEITASQIIEHGLDATAAAEAYVTVAIALADAFIESWEVKYRDNVLRPVTYIQDNIDPTWRPLLLTPPFPEYPSGHSTASAAAAEVLGVVFGDGDFVDRTHEQGSLGPRSFRSFRAAAEEAAMSRLFGGIHFRFGIEAGVEQGSCIGARVVSSLLGPRATGG
jgi:hypothetical protein